MVRFVTYAWGTFWFMSLPMLTSAALGLVHHKGPYMTYLPGSLPVVLAAPHGGSMRPEHIPDRDAGCWRDDECVWNHDCGRKDEDRCRATTVKDLATKELTLALREQLFLVTGSHPHVIINELHREKLDANRDLYEAAFGVPEMEEAWTEFHRHIYQAQASIPRPGLFIDMHGHGHPDQWAELGYLIKGQALDFGTFTPNATSIRALAGRAMEYVDSFEDILRGPQSFGGILEEEGFQCVPSPQHPGPAGQGYYSGGYNTRKHGSVADGEIDAIQIESPRDFRSEEQRSSYALALARTITAFLEAHYDFHISHNEVAPVQQNPDTRNGSKYVLASANLIYICTVMSFLYRVLFH